MKRRTELRRGQPMKRTAMKATAPPTRKRSMPRGKPKRRASKPVYGQAFWQTQREALHARCGGRCELGGCSLDNLGMHAHHRRLRSQGPDHGLHNLTALCPEHHEWVHQHPAAATALGFIVPSWADPAETPILRHDDRAVLLTTTGTYAEAVGEP